MRNRKASIHNVLVAHQQNMMIRRAIIASGQSKEYERMRRVYAMLLSDSKNALFGGSAMNDTMEQLDNPEVREQVGGSYISEIINKFKEKLSSINKGEIGLILDVLKAKGLVNKLHRIVEAGEKPKTEYEHLIADRLKRAGDFSSTLKMMGKLIAAKTPEEVGAVAGVGTDELREMWGIDKSEITLANWGITKWENLNKYMVGLPDHKLLVVKVGLSILKFSVIALLAKTSLAIVGAGILKVVAVLLLICVLTDTQATAQIVRKFATGLASLTPAILKDLSKGFKFLKDIGSKLFEGGRSLFKKLFRRAAVQQIQQMLRSNARFRQAYLQVR